LPISCLLPPPHRRSTILQDSLRLKFLFHCFFFGGGRGFLRIVLPTRLPIKGILSGWFPVSRFERVRKDSSRSFVGILRQEFNRSSCTNSNIDAINRMRWSASTQSTPHESTFRSIKTNSIQFSIPSTTTTQSIPSPNNNRLTSDCNHHQMPHQYNQALKIREVMEKSPQKNNS